jgi:hypothetical protein
LISDILANRSVGVSGYQVMAISVIVDEIDYRLPVGPDIRFHEAFLTKIKVAGSGWPTIELEEMPLFMLLGEQVGALRKAKALGKGYWDFYDYGDGIHVEVRNDVARWSRDTKAEPIVEKYVVALEAAIETCRSHYRRVVESNVNIPLPDWLDRWSNATIRGH